MKLTDISIKRPVFATVVIIALLAMGIVNFFNLPLTTMPNVDIPYISVMIIQPGASPDQMETKVAKKVEDAIGQASGVKHITTNISQSVCNTLVEFESEKSGTEAIQEVRDKLGLIRGDLPADIEEPVIAKYDFEAAPIMSLAVTGSIDNRELSQLVQDKVKKQLNTLDGIAAINVYGQQEREIQIKLNKEKLAAYNLTPLEVAASIQKQNQNVPTGTLSDQSEEMTLRTDSTLSKVSDFENISVAAKNDVQIFVKDVAEVVDGAKKQDSLAFYQGENAISLDIVKQSGGNTVRIVQSIKDKIDDIQKTLPSGVTIHIVNDDSIYVNSTVESVIKTMIEGCALAIIIVFIFLSEPRMSAISAVSLPTSIISTFTALKVMGFSLNMMTLIALSLSVGLLIDDAIVVIENIVRHLHMGKTPLQAAKDATSEIGLAVTATTLAVVAVFLPVAMVKGMIGKYFMEFGLTIVFSLLVSLFVSFTLVPVLSIKFGGHNERKLGRFYQTFNRGFEGFTNYYSKLLNLVLRRRGITIILIIVIFVFSLTLFSQISTTASSTLDIAQIEVVAEMDSGVTLEQAANKAKEIEGLLKDQPEILHIYTTVKADRATFKIQLPNKSDREKGVKLIGEEIRNSLKGVAGVNLSVNANPGMTDISYHIQGNDYAKIQAYAQEVKQVMDSIPAVRDVSSTDKAGSRESKLIVDRDMADEMGVSPDSVSGNLNTLFSGVLVSHFTSHQDTYDVRLSISDDQRKNVDALNGIYVSGSKGFVPLSQVTKKSFSTSVASITRYDKQREIQLSANLYGMSTGDFNKEFMNQVNSKVKAPDGVSLSVGGGEEEAGSSTAQLGIALLMGILFIYLILAAQFESFLIPLSILLSLPLAIIGAIWAIFLTHSEFSLTSMIGVIFLMGLVTKNAILLVDHAQYQRREGLQRTEALLTAGRVRIRPILMTSLAMIFGMMPSALAQDMGSETTAPMAIVIIGGLISSTLLTLLVIPIIYTLLDDLKNFLFRIKTRLRKKRKNNEIKEVC